MALGDKKRSPAHASGMRGSEPIKKSNAEEEAYEGKTDDANESSELQDSAELGTTVAEHIHHDAETGHHHLNLTTLGEALAKRGGMHDK